MYISRKILYQWYRKFLCASLHRNAAVFPVSNVSFLDNASINAIQSSDVRSRLGIRNIILTTTTTTTTTILTITIVTISFIHDYRPLIDCPCISQPRPRYISGIPLGD